MEQLDLIEYLYHVLIEEGLLVIIACYVIGRILITSVPKIHNNLTTPILSVCGIVFTFMLGVYSSEPLGSRIVKGMILGWVSTGFYEFIKGLAKQGYIRIPTLLLDNKHNKKDKGAG